TDLKAPSYSCNFTNEVMTNSIKKTVITTSLDWEKEVASVLSALFTEIFAADDDSAKGTVELLKIVANASIEILDVSSELVYFLSLVVSDKFPDSLNLEETISMLTPKFNGSEILLALQPLVVGLLSLQQWDPGGSVLSDDGIRRIIGECYYGAQEGFHKKWSVLKCSLSCQGHYEDCTLNSQKGDGYL
ncbi:programmed cell death protein 4-like, partial [Trifolium medium]|nr:programmed cell death protein 4-like [Trifolium medium]